MSLYKIIQISSATLIKGAGVEIGRNSWKRDIIKKREKVGKKIYTKNYSKC